MIKNIISIALKPVLLLNKALVRFSDALNSELCEMADERENRRKYGGLNQEQREDVLWHARRSEAGRDFAEYLCCTGYGASTQCFYRLLTDHGISVD